MKTQTLGFIGGGRITRIILQAFRNRSADAGPVVVFEPNNEISAGLKKQFPEIALASSAEEPAKQDILFLAVHPPVMMETLERIKGVVDEHTVVISLAPKVTIGKMSGLLPTGKIARMIPNATSYINKGLNPVTFHPSFPSEEKNVLLGLLKTLGKTEEVDENKLEAYAIVSAMLPTYFWFQWKKLGEIAQKLGLSEKESKKIIRQTLTRSLKLYFRSALSPDEVIDLIPVKPLGEYEQQILQMYETKLIGLYDKIKP